MSLVAALKMCPQATLRKVCQTKASARARHTSTLNGVQLGMLLFMMASGLTLIFSMMGGLNFAHAGLYMLGAFFAFQLSRWIGFWPALVIAPLLVGAIGAMVERYGLRHVPRRGHVPELLFTFGLTYVIQEVVEMIWGKAPVDFLRGKRET